MKFSISKQQIQQVTELEARALEQNKAVDYETLSLVPLTGAPRQWPQGDRIPQDYEGGKDDR